MDRLPAAPDQASAPAHSADAPGDRLDLCKNDRNAASDCPALVRDGYAVNGMCAELRVKDIDFQRREITIRRGKDGKDRLTMLPLSLVQPLRDQLAYAKALYEEDRLHRSNGVMLPGALEHKYPAASTQWGWFWAFPPDHESRDPRSGIVRRHHLYEQTIQRAIKRAVLAATN